MTDLLASITAKLIDYHKDDEEAIATMIAALEVAKELNPTTPVEVAAACYLADTLSEDCSGLEAADYAKMCDCDAEDVLSAIVTIAGLPLHPAEERIQQIGKGCSGFVYLTTSSKAVKVMEYSHALFELRAAAIVKGKPHFLQAYGARYAGENLYEIYYEYCPSVLGVGKERSNEEVEDIVYQVCEGLASLHADGYVYGDMKPEHLLYRSNRELVIADLGSIVKEGRRFEMTTMEYLDEEARRSDRYSDEVIAAREIDSWAVGCVWLELLARESPHFSYSLHDFEEELESRVSTDNRALEGLLRRERHNRLLPRQALQLI